MSVVQLLEEQSIWLLWLHNYAHSKNAAHLNYLVGGLAEFIEVSSSFTQL